MFGRRLILRQLLIVQKMTVFTQCLNPLTGTATWEEQDENYDYHQEVAGSAFADMLHDHERNQKYYLAIKSAIDKLHAANKEANVLDIGAGTGLLSMMAASCGADTVVACEALKPMAQCARRIIQNNGFGEKIKLIHKHSSRVTVGEDGDLPKRANILVTEVFDTELIGEGALATFRHAHKNLLEKDCIVIPSKGTIWVQVVESRAMSAWNRIQPISNVDDKTVLINVPTSVRSCSGAAALHDIQLSQLTPNSFKPLLPPQPMFRFDWSGQTPLLFNEKVSLHIDPVTSGNADAIFMWWDLNMDTDNQVFLSCAPVWQHPDAKERLLNKTNHSSFVELADEIPWRDHWMQAVYYFPSELSVKSSEPVNLIGYHDEYSFWFEVKAASQNNTNAPETKTSEGPACTCGIHIAYPRARIGQLNNQTRNFVYLDALRQCVNEHTVCLCLSDGSLLGLAASRFGAKKVYTLEANFLSRRSTEAFVEANKLSETVQIIESIDQLPSSDAIDLIFAEPYFVSSILPWENLRYWYIASQYSRQVKRILVAATVKAVAVEFKDLHKIRVPLGVCEGFDLSTFDKLIQTSRDKCDREVEAHPLWEYPAKALTAPFVIADFDLTTDVNIHKDVCLSDSVPMSENGLCNGVVIWVDWKLCTGSSITTGPIEDVIPGKRVSWDPYTRQGVYFLEDIPKVTANCDTLSWSFSFKPEFGSIDFQFNVSSPN